MRRLAVAVVAVCCMLTVSTLSAQSKKSAQQTANLEKSGEACKAAVQDALNSLDKLLAGYNSIIEGEAAKPESAYKKLVGDLKDAGKKIDTVKKEAAALDKEAAKFFKAWEQDLASISSDSLREKSATRMEASKQRYASLGETLAKVSQEFAPVVQNLNDQILFLGRDLSTEAVADLQDEAEELNQQAQEMTARVRELLQAEVQTQADAATEPEDD
jgi:uncharacterized protein YoxC